MQIVTVPRRQARAWADSQLRAGHHVSAVVLAGAPFEFGSFFVCIADDAELGSDTNFKAGNMASVGDARGWLASKLSELAAAGAKCLIVEDDLSRPTDPALIRSEIPSAFIGDRVVSWSSLETDNGGAAVENVMNVGSGYPRNAFVVSRSALELGLADWQQVPKSLPQDVVQALQAVIVAVFDDESYLIWIKDGAIDHPSLE